MLDMDPVTSDQHERHALEQEAIALVNLAHPHKRLTVDVPSTTPLILCTPSHQTVSHAQALAGPQVEGTFGPASATSQGAIHPLLQIKANFMLRRDGTIAARGRKLRLPKEEHDPVESPQYSTTASPSEKRAREDDGSPSNHSGSPGSDDEHDQKAISMRALLGTLHNRRKQPGDGMASSASSEPTTPAAHGVALVLPSFRDVFESPRTPQGTILPPPPPSTRQHMTVSAHHHPHQQHHPHHHQHVQRPQHLPTFQHELPAQPTVHGHMQQPPVQHPPTKRRHRSSPSREEAQPRPMPTATGETEHQNSSPVLTSSELKCKYRTGKCNNPRALKSHGEYHNLCMYHRLRANANQRKLDRKKKEQRQQQIQQSAGNTTAAAMALASIPSSVRGGVHGFDNSAPSSSTPSYDSITVNTSKTSPTSIRSTLLSPSSVASAQQIVMTHAHDGVRQP
ncbi:TPA: hypothetical protein N0F65_002715 [Lagenidium giganteum]|uniref:C2H2-type domain-containing protein n=1 Tax=Lagenidium giganteum TaxID=4803 RepID=A0AAV2Z1D9_9STRA|nr:TPA: hypothetical protein N0F65_002715 [Lagenidium giganteum]